MGSRLVEIYGIQPVREKMDEASPFASWFKKKQAKQDPEDFDIDVDEPTEPGDQLSLPGTAGKPQAKPEPPAPEPQKKEPEKRSAWSRLRKALDDPDFDPDNIVHVPERPAMRYYTPRERRPNQPEVQIQAPSDQPHPDNFKSDDPYEKQKHERERKARMRFDAVRELDKWNNIPTPKDPKDIGKGATIAAMKNRPGWYRAYYPHMEAGTVIIFNPETGEMRKKMKNREWFDMMRQHGGKQVGSTKPKERPTQPQAASPQTSQAARDRQEELHKMAVRTVKKYNPDVQGEVQKKELPDGRIEYTIPGGDMKVHLTKDGKLYKSPVEPEKGSAAAPPPEKPVVPSPEKAKELGDMDPGMQKGVQKQKHIAATKMSEQDLMAGLARENGYFGDEMPTELRTHETEKGIYFIPFKDGGLAPGTKKILFRSPDGKMGFVDAKKGGKTTPAALKDDDEDFE